MLDDDFKQIEEFLKNTKNAENLDNTTNSKKENAEAELFQKFETLVDQLIADRYADNNKENFAILNQLMFHSWGTYSSSNETALKDFAITVLTLKHVIMKVKNLEDNTILSEDDKRLYLYLMKLLVNSFKEEINRNMNFLKIFDQFLENSKDLFDASN